MKQALIKKTGEIFDIVSEYSMMKLSIELPFDLPDKENEEKKLRDSILGTRQIISELEREGQRRL